MLIREAYQENLRLGLLLVMLMDWCCDGIGYWRRRSTGSVDLNLIRMIKWDLLVLVLTVLGIVVHSTGSPIGTPRDDNDLQPNESEYLITKIRVQVRERGTVVNCTERECAVVRGCVWVHQLFTTTVTASPVYHLLYLFHMFSLCTSGSSQWTRSTLN